MRRKHDKGEIAKAGLEVVLSGGFDATGVETILKQANIPRGSFYNFFPSKEEFGLAIIDLFAENLHQTIQLFLQDYSLPPLDRIKRCFEYFITKFESYDCSKGCLIGNLALEMSDKNERFRLRIEEALQNWAKDFSVILSEAQKENAIPSHLDSEMVAENLISSWEGALLRAKVKKSSEPLKNFIYLFFERYLK